MAAISLNETQALQNYSLKMSGSRGMDMIEVNLIWVLRHTDRGGSLTCLQPAL